MQIETTIRSPSSINASFSRLSDVLLPPDELILKSAHGRDHLALSPPYDSSVYVAGHNSQRRLHFAEQISAIDSRLKSTPTRQMKPTSATSSSPRSLVTATTLTEDISPTVRHIPRFFDRNSVSASLDQHQDYETDTGTMVSYPEALVTEEHRKNRAPHSQISEAPSNDDVIANSESINGNDFQSFTSYVDIEAAAKRRLRSLFSRLNGAANARTHHISSQSKEEAPLQDLRKVLEGYGIESARKLSASTPPEVLLDLLYDMTEALRLSAQAMAHERYNRLRWQGKHREAQQQVVELGQEIRELSAEAVSMIQGIDEWRSHGADHGAFSQLPRMNSLKASMRSIDEDPKLGLQSPKQKAANLQFLVLSELDSNMQISEATLLQSHSSAASRQRMADQLQEDLDVAQVQIGSLQHRLDNALRADSRDATIAKLRNKIKDLEHMLTIDTSSKNFQLTVHEDPRLISLQTLLEESSADYQAMVVPLLEQIGFLRTELHAKNDSIDSKLARLPLSTIAPQQVSTARHSQSIPKDQEGFAASNARLVKQGLWESSVKGLLKEVTFLRAKQRRDALFRNDLAFQKQILMAIASQNRKNPLYRLTLANQTANTDCKPASKLRRCLMAVLFAARVKRLTLQWQRYKILRQSLKEVYFESRAEYFAL